MSRPAYIYKILPSALSNPRYQFPVPIPAGHLFPPTEADAKDGFVHMSTKVQVPFVLDKFFPTETNLALLKIDAGRLCGFRKVLWEQAGPQGNEFPHLYGEDLEGEYVSDFKEVERKGDSWADVVRELSESGWLE